MEQISQRFHYALIILFLLLTSAVSAGISSTIDRNPVRVNETFELTLHMKTAPVSRPALEGLPEAFEIVRSTNFYQRSSINGKTEVQAGWRYILRAKEEGVFTIPAFEKDGSKTKVFQLTVLPPVNSTSVGGQQDAIKLTATIGSDDIYVQQQILYTIRLYRAVQAQYASLTEPEMEGALLERLGEDRQFETEIEGVRYIVLERQYAIFPQQSGTQTISPVTFTAEVSKNYKQYSTIGRLRSRTKSVSLSTKPIMVSVKNNPDKVSSWWLPAIDVSLSETWQPEPPKFRVGEPVTWSYTIKAIGLTATQLPALIPATPEGLKFYPDTAKSENSFNQQGIIGLRTQKVAILPTKAGHLTLPELKLSWWNTKDNKAQELVIPERTIEVLPSLDGNQVAIPTNNTTNNNVVTEHLVEDEQSQPSSESDTDPLKPEPDNLDANAWKMTSIISLLLWIITALFLALRNRLLFNQPKKSKVTRHKALTTVDDIRRACKQNSAEKTKQAILNWCTTQEQLKSIHSLGELSKIVGESELADQLNLIERSLY
ncbi:MAG: protein BatD, partial [Gammaproteobacteria bacterium]|nr:protein BatD [Gammaproteobacteria bacterium]